MKPFALVSCLIALGLGVSACIPDSMRPKGSGTGYQTPAGIEGRWVDANGITSSFHNGVFETRSADTHEKLSEGNYVFQSQNLIVIEIRSLVRGTVSRANCALANPSRLLCTTDNGAQFALNRLG